MTGVIGTREVAIAAVEHVRTESNDTVFHYQLVQTMSIVMILRTKIKVDSIKTVTLQYKYLHETTMKYNYGYVGCVYAYRKHLALQNSHIR